MAFGKFYLILAFFHLGAALFKPSECFAQRGQDYIQQSNSIQTQLDGYPGFFDTEMAPRQTAVIEIPTSSMDFGINENLTVGTNALSALTALQGLKKTLIFGKVRYRIFSDKYLRSTITLNSIFSVPFLYKENSTKVFSLTNNYSFITNENLWYDFSINFAMLSNESLNKEIHQRYYEKIDAKLVTLTAGFHFFPYTSFGFQSHMTLPIYLNAMIDSPGLSLNFQSNNLDPINQFLGLRILADYKINDWSLFSFGALGAFRLGSQSEDSKSYILPLIFYSWRF